MAISFQQIKDKLILGCIFFIGVAMLVIFFHPPRNIKNFVAKNLSKHNFKSRPVNIPTIPKLKSYLTVLGKKSIFVKRERRQRGEEKLGMADLNDYIFHGIVKIKGTKYIAVYKKSNQSEYLVPEGQIFDKVMKIEKIGESSVTLKLYGGEEKEIPLYPGGQIE